MENEFTGFNCFMEESSEVGKAYIDMILQQEKASALDNKTRILPCLQLQELWVVCFIMYNLLKS